MQGAFPLVARVNIKVVIEGRLDRGPEKTRREESAGVPASTISTLPQAKEPSETEMNMHVQSVQLHSMANNEIV
jgi:hypothetical protein